MDNTSFIGSIASTIGSTEQALRLLISLLIVYPLLWLHRKYVKTQNERIHHLIFVGSGILLNMFNYGFQVFHSAVCVLFAWLLLKLIGGTLASVLITFAFQMGYLLTGYYVTSTETYDIKWTMPQCVLTLRLIALTFDLYDGHQNFDKLSSDQKKSVLSVCPSLLEIAAHSYFPASFLVGPQFPIKRYLEWVRGRLYPPDTPSQEIPGILRGLGGLVYLGIYQVGCNLLPDSYILSDAYMMLPFWKRLGVVALWGKITLYKYISCWLITEGACILAGIAYSGTDEKGVAQWRGCGNVKVRLYEFGGQFTTLIKSFNTNTNNWIMQYVYKRLRFLNNRYLSQVGALLFLSLWHGLHSGYYACFFMEFIVVYMEKRLSGILCKYPTVISFFDTPPVSYLVFMVLKLYTIIFMGYCLSSFVLLKSHRWLQLYSSLYYCGHIFYGGVVLYGPLLDIALRKFVGPPVESSKEDDKKKQ